jgi:hypothetical protein
MHFFPVVEDEPIREALLARGKRPILLHFAMVCGAMPSAVAISILEMRFLRSMRRFGCKDLILK